MSHELFDALFVASESLEKAVLYSMENNLKIPGLADAALELSQALCLLCPRPGGMDKLRS